MRYAASRSNPMTGVLVVLLGAWAGIVAFVGPLFGYTLQGRGAWVWNANHVYLHLAPGSAAVLAGLLIMVALPRGAISVFASVLAVAAGAWLVIGPLAWPVLEGAKHLPWAQVSPIRSLAIQVGANLGPGLLIVLFSSLAIGTTPRPARDVVLPGDTTADRQRVIAA
jgi:hypothetical protein